MQNIKEVQPILTSIFVLAHVAAKDTHDEPTAKVFRDIRDIAEYAVLKLFKSNCNLLMLGCVGQTNNSIYEQVQQILTEETSYKGGKK